MTALSSLKGIGVKTEEKLNTLNVFSAENILFLLPKTYLNLTEFGSLSTAEEGDFLLISVKITDKSPLIKKGGKSIAILTGVSDDAKIKLVFYNRDYILTTVHTGLRYRVYGKLSKSKGCSILNAQIEEDSDNPKLTGILPIYPLRGLLPQQTYRNIVRAALQKVVPEAVISNADKELNLGMAMSFAHQPKSFEEAAKGATRILLEKTILEMLEYRKKNGAKQARTRAYHINAEQYNSIKKSLPFTINMSQNVAIDTIIDGLGEKTTFNGILTGDVGSGKTAVAMLAAAYAMCSGFQAVMMAPTELVASQHYKFAATLFSAHGYRVALLTSSVTGRARKDILYALKHGEIDFLIGTHSVFNEEVEMPKLAFIIVDEQHRFGVDARSSILKKADAADALYLTATPIPRTVKLLYLGAHTQMTLEARFDAAHIKTRVVKNDKLDGMFRYLAQRAECGEKSFIVAPRISDMEGIEFSGAEEVFCEFSKKFPMAKAGLLTGKMSFLEKELVAERFKRGEIFVLVATTVVEVGLDVPDADVIAVLHADRLGLASLHQLRGRVGRNGQEAYCFLHTNKEEETARLTILTETTDGMKIAEQDFCLRGSGEIVGAKQHGKDVVLSGISEEILLTAKRLVDLKLS